MTSTVLKEQLMTVLFTLFLIYEFHLAYILFVFSQLKADICSVVRSFFCKRKKRYLYMPWLKRWITVFQFYIGGSFFVRYFSLDVVTCVLVCVCNSLTYLLLAISAGLMLH